MVARITLAAGLTLGRRFSEGLIMTVAECAARLSVSSETIRRELRSGRLGGLKIRSAIRITEDDLRAYIDGARIRPATENRKPAPAAPWD